MNSSKTVFYYKEIYYFKGPHRIEISFKIVSLKVKGLSCLEQTEVKTQTV